MRTPEPRAGNSSAGSPLARQVRSDHLNVFPALPGGDPVQAVVMSAETANIDSVMVAGQFLKRHGRLLHPDLQMRQLKAELLGVRERVMARGSHAYRPAPAGERVYS
jgi:5-methylthioadenosine/S-adenosylhomocysteine deaminase